MPRFKYLETVDIGSAIYATTRHASGRSAQSITVNASDYTADANGQKIFAPGHFVVEVSANSGRLLPRGLLTTAIAGNTTAGGALLNAYQLFKVGDVLWRLQSYNSVTFALTWAPADTVTLTIGNYTAAYTAGSATLATVATNVAAAINAHPIHGTMVEAIAAGAVVYLHSRTFNELLGLTVVGDGTAGDGTATRGAATFTAPYSIGTISAITTDTGVITLGASAPNVPIPVGTRIGILPAKVLGIYGHSIDMATAPRDIYAADEADVYTGALPYLDDDIKRQLPGVNFQLKF